MPLSWNDPLPEEEVAIVLPTVIQVNDGGEVEVFDAVPAELASEEEQVRFSDRIEIEVTTDHPATRN